MIHHTSKRWEERLEVFSILQPSSFMGSWFYLVKHNIERLFEFYKSYPVIFHTSML